MEDYQDNDIYGVNLGEWYKSLANGTKSRNWWKLLQKVEKPRDTLFNTHGKKLETWLNYVTYGMKLHVWPKNAIYGIKH